MPDPREAPRPDGIFTVSRLNLEARAVVEGAFPALWVEGEISNLARPRSGHMYFSLKDEHCQVRCAMFRSRNRALTFEPGNGVQVLARARASLYPERGEFQLVVDHLEEAGEGALRRAFDALKARLAAEGLFAEELKREPPRSPACMGVITSATGAALRDVLSVTGRRFPAMPVVVYPVPVQGEAAVPAIVRALGVAGARGDCDVLLLVRGGGSLEDLWAFNEEAVARAIRGCAIPVVCGVGHETDFTIADLAADRRAPTPSAAAELVTPDSAELAARFEAGAARLRAAGRARLAAARQRVESLGKRLRHPRLRIAELWQRMDGLQARLAGAAQARLGAARARHAGASGRLGRFDPRIRLQAEGERGRALRRRLDTAAARAWERRRDRHAAVARALETVGPTATLERGYAILTRRRDGAVVRAPADAPPGERLQARLANGRVGLVAGEPEDPDREGSPL